MDTLNFYCIYKKNDARSENLLEQCIKSAQKFNLIVKPFEGIYKNIKNIIEEKNLKINPLGQHKIKTDGVLGCFLSHYELWNLCIIKNKPIGVLEYDAKFINPLPNQFLHLFNDYLNLDFNRHLYLDNSINYQDICENDNREFSIKKLEESNIESKIKKPFKYINNNHIKGAFGYVIKPAGAKLLIDASLTYGILPADIQPNLYYCQMYYTIPSIVMLNPQTLNQRSKNSHTSR